MMNNPDYAKMFRSRPARFVLPMKMEIGSNKNHNLINLDNTAAEAYYLKHNEVMVKPERICNIGCETPRINYENYLGKNDLK